MKAWVTWLFRLPDLLDEDTVTEVHIVFPRHGTPKMFAAKLDQPTEAEIMRTTQGIVESGLAFARMYGYNVGGTIGATTPPPPAGPPAAG